MDNKYKQLLEQFRRYTQTEESRAILFVKKHLKQADNTVWVNILKCREANFYPSLKPDSDKDKGPFFEFIRCELYPRKTQPKYPPKRKNQTPEDYVNLCRAITWEAAHNDIDDLAARGYYGPVYEIFGQVKAIPGATLFRPDAPPEIQALAANPNDRTDPLWDEAIKYLAAREEFKIMNIRRAKYNGRKRLW